MTKEQRDKLRTLALAATPGEWYHVQAFQRLADERTIHGKVPGQRVDFVSTERKPVHKKIIIPMEGRESTARSEDMAYIAAANPATLLALLDRVDELEGAAEPAAWLVEHDDYPTGVELPDETHTPEMMEKDAAKGWRLTPLYAAPPPPERAVPVEMNLGDILAAREPDVASDDYCRGLTDGWNAYRKTLLAAPGAGGGE